MATMDAPPKRVVAAAQRWGFGSLIAAKKGRNPFLKFVFGIGLALASFGVLAGLNYLGESSPHIPAWGLLILRPIVVILLLACIIFAVAAFKELFRWFQSYYLYTGGFVILRGRRTLAVAWSEVVEVWRIRAVGQIASYRLALTEEYSPTAIELEVGEDDEMARWIEEMAQVAGVPVVERNINILGLPR